MLKGFLWSSGKYKDEPFRFVFLYKVKGGSITKRWRFKFPDFIPNCLSLGICSFLFGKGINYGL